VASLPLRVDKGQTVDVRFVYERREWHPGDELQLTTENCQHIAITLGQFGKELGGELINGIHTMLTSKPR
jgi:hypothetical protein